MPGATDRCQSTVIFYRNRVQRAAWRLRRKYYQNQNKVHNLRQSDSRRWWQSIKELTGHATKTQSQLTGLANRLTNGDFSQLLYDA